MVKTSLNTLELLAKLEENGKRLEQQQKAHNKKMAKIEKSFTKFFKKMLT